jgi:hypothetical protein
MIESILNAIEQPLILWLSGLYIFSEAISIYDTRLIQWKKIGSIPQDTPTPPPWTAIFGILGWVIIIAILFLNWQYALTLMLAVFILKVLPVMETLGEIITQPFVKR